MSRPWRRLCAATGGLALAAAVVATPSYADGTASIDHVQPEKGSVKILFSVPGVADQSGVDLGSVSVSIAGTPVTATATPAGESRAEVRRTAILAIDTSNSMKGTKFEEAKQAASSFLAAVPDDVYVGVVTFAGDVVVRQKPTLDRAALGSVLSDLTLTKATRVYDGLLQSVSAAGADGQRSVLLLTDGRDTSKTPLTSVTDAISAAGVKVDVVALGQGDQPSAPLTAISTAGEGTILSTQDPHALSQLFADEADVLARQILVTADVPTTLATDEADLSVSVDAAGQSYTDSAYVTVRTKNAPAPASVAAQPVAVSTQSGFVVTPLMMLAALLAAGLAVGYLLWEQLSQLGGATAKRKLTVEERITAYSQGGGAMAAAALAAGADSRSVGLHAKERAERTLARNTALEARIASRLDGAALSLRPSEWLLLHVGIVFAAGLLGMVLSRGNILAAFMFLVIGAVVPWVYLGVKRTRRLAAFNSQLPDTLQLMAGSLSAGLSLAQSLDTIESEGSEPMSGEFRRALVETRLGVPIEDALDAVAERMESRDFEWTVMAVRIQREVGGNLAELLLNVAATMREREYLRRHVKGLSAEGRLSAYILSGLPPVFLLYLLLSKPGYVHPMFSTPLGWLMVVAMCTLLAVGSFWMSRLVKVEV